MLNKTLAPRAYLGQHDNAASAASENPTMLPCPRGSTTKAASSGPRDEPALPPT
jgi:hypothetical protein